MAGNETKIRITAEDKASRVVGNVKKELLGLSSVGSRLSGVVSPLGAISLAAAGLGAAVLGVKNFVNQIDDLAATAAGLGVTAVQLAEMRSKAAESAVGVDQLDGALAKLNERLADAKEGNKEAIAAFARFGIDPRKVTDTEHAMRLIADRVRELGNTAERGAALGDLLGQRYGPKLAGYLSGGAEGLRQFTGLTDESVRESLKLQTELNKLSNSFERLKNTVLGAVVPAINSFIEALEGGSIQARIAGLTADINRLAKQTPGRRQPSGRTALEELRDLVEQRAKLIEKLEEQDTRFETPPKPLPKPKEAPKVGAEEISEARRQLAQYIEQLERQRQTLLEISEVERALLTLKELGPLGDIPQVRELVLAQAEANDQLKERKKLMEQLAADEQRELEGLAAAWRRIADEQLANQRRLEDLTGRTEMKRLNEDLRIINDAYAEGKITLDEYLEAYKKVFGAEGQQDIEKSRSLAEELGLTFTSAFEDAIVQGKGLRDILKGIEQDILRIVTRKLVTEPLGNALTGILQGAVLGGIFGGGPTHSQYGKFAAGGYIQPGTWGLVGERGPEMVFGGRTGANVVDAERSKRMGRAITVNVNVPANTSGASAQQIGAAAARALAIADARFN